MRSTPHTAACLLALLPVLACAEVYKWVDANGKVQYGDQPPPGTKTSSVKVTHNTAAAVTPLPGANKPGFASQMAPVAPQADAGQDKISKAEAQQRCTSITHRIQRWNDAPYITGRDAKGKEYDLNEAEVKHGLEELRKEQAEWCGKAGK